MSDATLCTLLALVWWSGCSSLSPPSFFVLWTVWGATLLDAWASEQALLGVLGYAIGSGGASPDYTSPLQVE